jgi:Family of unknown function (DUF6518)
VRERQLSQPIAGCRDRIESVMRWLAIILGGFVFGAADQFLGTIHAPAEQWGFAVSNLSAPWLLIAFAAGLAGRHRQEAVVLGLAATFAALLGYFAMTLSPMEGVALADVPSRIAPLLAAQRLWIAGGVVMGPLFGYLGCIWRTKRAVVSAVAVAGALWLEPAIRQAAGRLEGPRAVWMLEVGAGVLVAVVLAISYESRRRAATLL